MSETKETHVHVLEDGTILNIPMENMDIITAMRTDESSFEPSVESHWTPGINKTYGRRRQRLFRGY